MSSSHVKKSQLPIELMAFAGKHCSMTRLMAKVTCIVCWGMPDSTNCHMCWRLTFSKRSWCYCLLFYSNQWTKDSKLISKCSKISLKSIKTRLGRALESGPRAQLALGRAQKLQEDENHGTWTTLGLSLIWGLNTNQKRSNRAFGKVLYANSWKK